jgi:hypothetical protein
MVTIQSYFVILLLRTWALGQMVVEAPRPYADHALELIVATALMRVRVES